MHRHKMQQSNIYLGIYIIEYYFFWKNQGVTVSQQFGPQNRWQRFASGLASKPLGRFLLVWPQNR
jgi:hypothetical protein